MNKREMKKELKSMVPQMETYMDYDGPVKSIYLGSYLSLDPCGRYHHFLSPNGATSKCEAYWDRLNAAAEEMGGWIGGSEGDGLDVYFYMGIDEEELDT